MKNLIMISSLGSYPAPLVQYDSPTKDKTPNDYHTPQLGVVGCLISLALIMLGCQGGESPSSLPELYIGTEGLDAYFVAESVPGKVLAGGTFETLLAISNKGAYDADPSKTTVVVRDSKGHIDFEEAIIPAEKLGVNALEGKLLNQVGSINAISVSAIAKPDSGEGTKTTGLLAQICYGYETSLTANVCIDTSSTSLNFKNEKKPCIMEQPVILQSQGAPVAIKKIETIKVLGKDRAVKPIFSIFISNEGNGEVTDADSPDSYCTPSPGSQTPQKLNTVKIESVTLLGTQLACEREKTLAGKEDFFVCEYKEGNLKENTGIFATPLSIRLKYGYTATSSPVPLSIDPQRTI